MFKNNIIITIINKHVELGMKKHNNMLSLGVYIQTNVGLHDVFDVNTLFCCVLFFSFQIHTQPTPKGVFVLF